MTFDEQSEEARRRIQQALNMSAAFLDLSDLTLERIPEEIGGLRRLRKLKLSRFIPAQISLQDISSLSTLSNLRELTLRASPKLVDITPVSNLRMLRRLDLGGCASLKDISPLSGLKKLRRLNLDWCSGVSEFSSISNLVQLRELSFVTCIALRDISFVNDLPRLRRLSLHWCKSLKSISNVIGLHTLRKLDLACCTGLSTFEPFVTLLERLDDLILFGCKFNDLPPAVYGRDEYHNVIDLVREFYRRRSD